MDAFKLRCITYINRKLFYLEDALDAETVFAIGAILAVEVRPIPPGLNVSFFAAQTDLHRSLDPDGR